MLSGLHSLRSAPNEMPSAFSASSGQSTKYLASISRHPRSAAMALIATLCVLGVTSWVLSTLRLVALVLAVACLPIRGLLALRAAVLRLAVSLWAAPNTAAHFLAFAPAVP
jgi:hypothetical protein